MPPLNLLPWRQIQRQKQQRRFFIVLIFSSLGAIIIVDIMHWNITNHIDFQNQRNQLLERAIATTKQDAEEIIHLEKQREKLLEQITIFGYLQNNLPQSGHLFAELATLLPTSIYLTALRQKGSILTIEGIAQSNAQISSLMANIENSQQLTEPHLEIIQTMPEKKDRLSRFILQTRQITPSPLIGIP